MCTFFFILVIILVIAYIIEKNKTPDKKYVVVIVNEGDEKDISFNMLGYDAEIYTTDAERNLELTGETKGHKKITIGAKSITTVVFEK